VRRNGAWPLAALLSVAAMSPACSAARAASTPTVRATIGDFRIWLGRASIVSGPTTFVLHSRGPSTHEFKIARTEVPIPADKLPLGKDALTVNEESPLLIGVRSLTLIDIGQTVRVTVDLPPGNYVFFCNFEGHYLGGMHVGLKVDAPPP
jgi:uncharacterized cupredoxin-like copper-binding protein